MGEQGEGECPCPSNDNYLLLSVIITDTHNETFTFLVLFEEKETWILDIPRKRRGSEKDSANFWIKS
jgi:hypothetical protein